MSQTEKCDVCGEDTTFFWSTKERWVHPICYTNEQGLGKKYAGARPVLCPHGFDEEIKCPNCRIAKGLVQTPPKKPSKPAIDRNAVRVGRNAPATSRKAAERVLPNTGTKRRMIYDAMVEAGEQGLCDHELEQLFGWVHQSASAARNSLMNDGWCVMGKYQRMTPQGNMANAYIAVLTTKCFIDDCKDPVTNKFFGKDLCAYHFEVSSHGD